MINSSKLDFVSDDSWVIPFTSRNIFQISTFQINKKSYRSKSFCSLIYSDEDFISQ